MKKYDIKNREDIHVLVSTFYNTIRDHNVLGVFFNETISNWDAHINHLTSFWERQLFLKGKYTGNPLEKHIEVDAKFNNSITNEHFGMWINIWFETINDLFEGEIAENAKHRARKMSTFLYLKIFESRQ